MPGMRRAAMWLVLVAACRPSPDAPAPAPVAALGPRTPTSTTAAPILPICRSFPPRADSDLKRSAEFAFRFPLNVDHVLDVVSCDALHMLDVTNDAPFVRFDDGRYARLEQHVCDVGVRYFLIHEPDSAPPIMHLCLNPPTRCEESRHGPFEDWLSWSLGDMEARLGEPVFRGPRGVAQRPIRGGTMTGYPIVPRCGEPSVERDRWLPYGPEIALAAVVPATSCADVGGLEWSLLRSEWRMEGTRLVLQTGAPGARGRVDRFFLYAPADRHAEGSTEPLRLRVCLGQSDVPPPDWPDPRRAEQVIELGAILARQGAPGVEIIPASAPFPLRP